MQNKKQITIAVNELDFCLIGVKEGPFLVQYFRVKHPHYTSAEIPIDVFEANKQIITVKQFKSAILSFIKYLIMKDKLPFAVECGLRALVNNDTYIPALKHALESQTTLFKLIFEDFENYSAMQNRVFFTIPNQSGYRIKVKIVISPAHRYRTYFTVNNNKGKIFNAVRWEKYKNPQSLLKQFILWMKLPSNEHTELLKDVKFDVRRYIFSHRHQFATLISVLNDYTRKVQ